MAALLWETVATVLELGRAVQAAWQEGAKAARAAQEMDQALQQRATQLRQ